MTIKTKTPLKAIREFCVTCVGGKVNGHAPKKKISDCKLTDCPLHDYRLGKNPFWGSNHDEKTKRRLNGLALAKIGYKNPKFFGDF